MVTKRKLFKRGEFLGELLIRPFKSFASLQASGGILILLVTITALWCANSRYAESYERLLNMRLLVGLNGYLFDKPLMFWINEGLMTIFFFVVGLEIKREILVGELASFRKAALPLIAAIGGMILPASIFFLLNPSGPAAGGWGIPMATDIAFTLGALTVLRKRIPRSLAVFVAALAIVDDLGAVLVIALFYSAQISFFYLEASLLLFLILVGFNILGYRRPLPYILVGGMIWLAMSMSGVHSTVAGILVAMAIPARSRINTDQFLGKVKDVLNTFACAGNRGPSIYANPECQAAVHTLGALGHSVEPPLLRIEHALNPWVVFVVVPIFALANAGVNLEPARLGHALSGSVGVGIILGLVLGKQIGIFTASLIAVKCGLAAMPAGVDFRHLYGASILCGIGFTMSLFIADLAFGQTAMLDAAKIGILAGSLLSFIIGTGVLFVKSRRGTAGSVSIEHQENQSEESKA
ncbi:MAG: Na+/H+ antiporter NhaA [Desulfomonilaceae bacterium]